MEWSAAIDEMTWWVDGLRPFRDHCVGSIVPDHFAAVGRLFHPVELDKLPADSAPETWSAVAKRYGRIAHPEMQLHAISTPIGETPSYRQGNDCWTGELPAAETTCLQEVVARHTTTPDNCWFGVWDGYGQLRGGRAVSPRRPGLVPRKLRAAGPRNRQYYLLHGALDEMATAQGLIGNQTPNLWWPKDRAWFVATEIDFCWTLIGGSEDLIEELTATDGLEVMISGFDHLATVDADQINT